MATAATTPLTGASEDGDTHDYQRLDDSVEADPEDYDRLGDVKLDWRSAEQRRELREWWHLTWPAMLLYLSSTTFMLVDIAFLGHLGTEAQSSKFLAAASTASILFEATLSIFVRGFLYVE